MARFSFHPPARMIGGFLCVSLLGAAMLPAHAIVPIASWNQVQGPDGEVRALYGNESAPLSADTPEARAREFLSDQAATLGLSSTISDLELTRADHDAMGDHVRFRQTYLGHPVFGAEVAVHLDGDRAYMATSSYRSIHISSSGPSLSSDQTLQLIRTRPGLPSALTLTESPQLVVWPRSSEDVWAWRYSVQDANGLPWEVLADAETGANARAFPRYFTLNAAVYPENPIATPVREYRDLPHLDSSGLLEGPYADVRLNGGFGLRGIVGDRLVAGKQGFDYAPGDGRSNQVNVYYHTNRVHDFFRDIGASSHIDYQLPVLMRFAGSDFLDNAAYVPDQKTDGSLIIGDSSSGRDLSLDADVIYHEYGHFVVHQTNQDLLSYSTVETGGLNEGFSDYFAATLSGDSAIGEFIAPAIQGTPSLRNLTNRRRYPEDTGESLSTLKPTYTGFTEPHVVGELASGSLWDLRNVLGADVTDRLLMGAIPIMTGSSTLPEVRADLLQVDQKLYNGAHQDQIKKVFDARGIGQQAARYLEYDNFSTLKQKATVFIGPIYGGPADSDAYIVPGEIGASFASGRNYHLSGFVQDVRATTVSLSITDAQNQPIPALLQDQDISKRIIASALSADPGRVFDFTLKLPNTLVGQTVRVTLTFHLGASISWASSVKVDVVADQGPAQPVVPEPTVKAQAVLGDSDGDGKITTADVIAALRVMIGVSNPDPNKLLALDVAPAYKDGTVGDDRVTLADVQELLRLATGRLR